MRSPIVIVALSTLVCTAPALAQVVNYVTPPSALATYAYGKERGFNFDSVRPLVNPAIGQADIAQLQYNGGNINGASIVDINGCETDELSHICRYQENAPAGDWVTRVRLFEADKETEFSHRTQLNSYWIESQKRYILDLEFKLDADWNFGMNNGAGLIWQLKDEAQSYQFGNPVLGLNLYGDELRFDIKYPQSAATSDVWPMPSVSWAKGEYQDVVLPIQKMTRGEYHRVQLIFYADDTPNNAAITTGKGFIVAFFDGKPWFEHTGPTLQPDSKLPHKMSWGWYQWQGKPDATRTIYYRKHKLLEWKQ